MANKEETKLIEFPEPQDVEIVLDFEDGPSRIFSLTGVKKVYETNSDYTGWCLRLESESMPLGYYRNVKAFYRTKP